MASCILMKDSSEYQMILALVVRRSGVSVGNKSSHHSVRLEVKSKNKTV